jgi:hypothetical protein
MGRAGSNETGAVGDSQAVITSLEAEFPGWRVWRTADAGTWWATRRGPRWMREPRTVAADIDEDLRAKLREAGGSGTWS